MVVVTLPYIGKIVFSLCFLFFVTLFTSMFFHKLFMQARL